MAIYSLRLSSVGKTTQKQPFTGAAHLKYITRKEAVTHVMAARMPDTRRQAIAWLKREERDDRKNARVIDKVVLALPKELSRAHWKALVTAFAEALTRGRASWFAAFHTKGKDAGNPHCHLVLRDRDFETGRRVVFLSAGPKEAAERRVKGKAAPTTLKAIRELWAKCANAALQVAGRTERIDHRSLRAQGQARPAQVHEGPNVRAMHKRGTRPRSRDRLVRNSPLGKGKAGRTRVVRYAAIDRGMTRVEYNAALRQAGRDADPGRERERATAADTAHDRSLAHWVEVLRPEQKRETSGAVCLVQMRSDRNPAAPKAQGDPSRHSISDAIQPVLHGKPASEGGRTRGR